jgi:hypothetical protein
MANKKGKSLILSMLLALVFVFSALNASFALEVPRLPSPAEIKAFHDLFLGHTAWPVWKVDNDVIKVDGKLDEEAWVGAKRIFLTGEWFWNSNAQNRPYLYTSLSDFIAIWRVLYDDHNMYISCEFFDDKHSEGTGSEPWYKNDGVELTLLPPVMMINGIPIIQPQPVRRIWRRFTARGGLIGLVSTGPDTVRYPCPITECGWISVEPEGSPNLGGISSAAAAIENPVIRQKYPGAWVLEFKVPIAAANQDSTSHQTGQVFKMNLKICDDDPSVTSPPEDYLNVGMERYISNTINWWDSLPRSNEMLFYPTFVLAGFKNEGTRVLPPPDEINLYCQHTPELYESLTVKLFSSVSTPIVNKSGADFLQVFPNPITSTAAVEFNMGESGRVGLKLFNSGGVLIWDSGEKACPSGRNRLMFDDRAKLVSGHYILRLNAGDRELSKQIFILR